MINPDHFCHLPQIRSINFAFPQRQHCPRSVIMSFDCLSVLNRLAAQFWYAIYDIRWIHCQRRPHYCCCHCCYFCRRMRCVEIRCRDLVDRRCGPVLIEHWLNWLMMGWWMSKWDYFYCFCLMQRRVYCWWSGGLVQGMICLFVCFVFSAFNLLIWWWWGGGKNRIKLERCRFVIISLLFQMINQPKFSNDC